MPRFTLLSAIIISLLFQSCTKGRLCCYIPTETYQHFTGTLTLDRDFPWNETTFKDTVRNDSLIIWSSKSNSDYTIALKFSLKDGLRDEINIYRTIAETSLYSYTLGPNKVLVYKLAPSDQNGLSYYFKTGDTDANKGNWLIGHFTYRYKLSNPSGVARIDTAHINFRGSFGVKLTK